MEKKEYRKIMKDERHICYRNAWHLGCATCYFVMIIVVTTLLVFFNELPVKPFFVVYAMAAIFVAVPTIILDQLNDKEMREGMEYYEKNHKTKPGIDFVGYIKTVEVVAFALLILSMTTIYFRFLKYDSKEVLLGDLTTIRASKTIINKTLNIYIPDTFKKVRDNLEYRPDGVELGIVYNDADAYIGIYFINIKLSESEVYNYVSSVEYYYKEKDNIEVTKDLNSISLVNNKKYYYISYYSYQGKLVQITYACDEDKMNKWVQGFTAINENVNFE